MGERVLAISFWEVSLKMWQTGQPNPFGHIKLISFLG